MKLGTSLLMIVLVLIGFGFLLSDNHHLSQELQEVSAKVAEANKLAVAASENLRVCQTEQAAQKLEIENLQTEVSQLNSALSVAKEKNAELEKNSALLADPSKGALINLDPLVAELIIAVQIGLALLQRLKKGWLGSQLFKFDGQKRYQSVKVTEEELKMIIERRRGK